MKLVRSLGIAVLFGVASPALGCVGVSGGGLVEFRAAAAGPRDATGGALSFRSRAGFDVTLRRATLHVGALYLNRTVPLTSERASSCVLPSTYVAQVLSAVDVDLLSAQATPFPSVGTGLQDRAVNGEVWLTGTGDVNASEDKTAIFVFEGEATKAGITTPFRGRFTIGQNRAAAPQSAALPGSNPMCQQRIVTGIPTDIVLHEGANLLLRADPRPVLDLVDFDQLAISPDGVGEFADDDVGQPDLAAFNALRSSRGVYTFELD